MGGVTRVNFATTSAVTLYIPAVAIGATRFNIKNSTAGHNACIYVPLMNLSKNNGYFPIRPSLISL